MPLDLGAIRQGLAANGGKPYWRGLEELVETEEFREMLHREFPEQASSWTDPVTRRQFLMLMGASLALAGVTGCSLKPAAPGKVMPYVRQPEEIIPGKPLFFATAVTLGGLATGVLVESHEGRPTKVEGNPDHPASRGATDLFAQASVLGLYDPDRSQSVTYRGRSRSWAEALADIRAVLERQRSRHGAGLRILTETVTSPALAAQLHDLLAGRDLREARWYQYEPAGRHNAFAGARQAFNDDVNTYYNFRKADRILALDADFLSCGPGHLAYVRDFAARRRVRTNPPQETMSRLYVVEPSPTNTGLVADHRLPVRAGDIENFARAVAAELGVPGAAGGVPGAHRQWVIEVARDLKEHAGRSIIITGDGQPAGVHALVHAMNIALGNHRSQAGGRAGEKAADLPPVVYTRHVEARPVDQVGEIRALAREMEQGQVEVLLILGGNPVFNAPADLEFGARLAGMRGRELRRIHLGLYQDETAVLCDWHIPEAHALESWGDARAYDGTASIIQPLIAPLYGGRSAHEVLAAFARYPERQGYDLVRDYWQKEYGGRGDFGPFWEQAVQRGVVPDFKKQFAPLGSVSLRPDWASRGRQPPEEAPGPLAPGANAPGSPGSPGSPERLEIVFRPDPTIFDGRFANNGWLQELPKPVTKLTWDNAALMSPSTAKALGVSYRTGRESGRPGNNGGEHGQAVVDLVELSFEGRKVRAPVWVTPGHADNSVTVHLGYGRTHAGQVGTGTGFNACQLRTRTAMWFADGLEVQLLGEHYTLACTQMHHGMDGREPVKASTLAAFTDPEHPENRQFAKKLTAAEHEGDGVRRLVPGPKEEPQGGEDSRLIPLTLYDRGEYPYDGYRWGMAIDLGACVGCSACVVACQAENNIPVVGKTEVTRGREMHWLRIDRYFQGDPDNPSGYFQPVPCMHCETAPCELVCPVGATVHSHDGLNDMVYNRCVGTRYCSNNCPYKVRRFNFLEYADYATGSLKLGRNPNVTVRSRGVMEKCTYCVQRIRAADIEAEKAGRRLRDGDVVTACQAACPAGAIVFGDINDRASRVYRMKAEPLNYALLAELNTQPRTTYLAALRNPNPRMP